MPCRLIFNRPLVTLDNLRHYWSRKWHMTILIISFLRKIRLENFGTSFLRMIIFIAVATSYYKISSFQENKNQTTKCEVRMGLCLFISSSGWIQFGRRAAFCILKNLKAESSFYMIHKFCDKTPRFSGFSHCPTSHDEAYTLPQHQIPKHKTIHKLQISNVCQSHDRKWSVRHSCDDSMTFLRVFFFFIRVHANFHAKTQHWRPTGAILHASPSKDVSTVYVTNCLHSWNIVCTCEPDMGEA